MNIYPGLFLPQQIISRYECSKDLVIWHAFTKSLSESYRSYHKPLKHSGTWYLCQCNSLFEGHGTLGDLGNLMGNSGDGYISASFDTAALIEDFPLVKVIECEEDGTTDEPAEIQMERELKFHVPLFILYYNRAKKQFSSLEQEVYNLRAKLYSDKLGRDNLLGIPQDDSPAPNPSPYRDQSHLGMAAELRNSQAWKDYVTQEQSRSPFSDFKHSSLPGSPDHPPSRSSSPTMQMDVTPPSETHGKHLL